MSNESGGIIGTQISHYRILAKLGEGGMGEVYRAEDTRLGRPVAVKLLTIQDSAPAASGQTWEAQVRGAWESAMPESSVAMSPRQRFLKEARAASALNHPGIVAIYDIGESDGRLFIAMEIVDGETLRKKLDRGSLEQKPLLRTAIQLAEVLERAHGAGIVHRDIKPENIMVTADGHTKLLDFGIAKLKRPQGESSQTVDDSRTQPGTVLGTVSYMSPEQTVGAELDHRSDLFSFGSVLYECVTGRKPFTGTTVETMYGIAHIPPDPLANVRHDAPEELIRIVEKLMEKEKEDRYQSAAELAVDLRRLERKVSSQPLALSSQHAVLPQPPSPITQPPAPSPIPRPPTPLRYIAVGIAIGAVLTELAVLAWLGFRRAPSGGSAQVYPVTHLRREIRTPALSPDGRMLAFIADDQVYIALTASGDATQITKSSEVKGYPRFSPDGTRILFAFTAEDRHLSDLWEIPALGGTPRRVLNEALGGSWSPDGSRLAVVRRKLGEAGALSKELYVGDAQGNNLRKIFEAPGNPVLYHAWTPDGRSVAVLDGYRSSFAPKLRVIAADGSGSRLLVESDLLPARPEVSADGKWVYYSAVKNGLVNLWRIPTSGGTPQQVTFSAGEDQSPLLNADGQLYFLNARYRSTIHLVDQSGARQVTEETLVGQARFSPDGGHIAYIRRTHSGTDLGIVLVAKRDGSNAQRVSPQANFNSVVWSRDGKLLALNSSETAELVEADSGRQILTVAQQGSHTAVVDFGPSGQLLLSRVPAGGGAREAVVFDPRTKQERVFAKTLQPFGWSSDGQWIGLVSRDPSGVFVAPAAGGEPQKIYAGVANSPAFLDKKGEVLIGTSVFPPQFVTVPINSGKGGPSKPWSSLVMLDAITRFGPQSLKAFDPAGERALMVVGETDMDVYRMKVEK